MTDIVAIIDTIVNAVTLFASGIQWAFDTVTTVFTSFLSLWKFVGDGLQVCYRLLTSVPGWLTLLATAFIAYSLVKFVIHLGGD